MTWISTRLKAMISRQPASSHMPITCTLQLGQPSSQTPNSSEECNQILSKSNERNSSKPFDICKVQVHYKSKGEDSTEEIVEEYYAGDEIFRIIWIDDKPLFAYRYRTRNPIPYGRNDVWNEWVYL